MRRNGCRAGSDSMKPLPSPDNQHLEAAEGWPKSFSAVNELADNNNA